MRGKRPKTDEQKQKEKGLHPHTKALAEKQVRAGATAAPAAPAPTHAASFSHPKDEFGLDGAAALAAAQLAAQAKR